MLEAIRAQYLKHGTVDKIGHRTDLDKPKKGRSGRSVTGTARAKTAQKAPVANKAAKAVKTRAKAGR
jgi:hypothetical protein